MPSNAKIKFRKNSFDIYRLFTIRTGIPGSAPDRKYQVEVLNKSAFVFITACWESYIEDVVEESFDFMINNCDDPGKIPTKVKTVASQPLKDDSDNRKVWNLAGTGWKKVLKQNKKQCIEKFIGHFHTPKPDYVDELVEIVLGLRKISSNWKWQGMAKSQSTSKLNKYITVRGNIAHRTRHKSSVTKTMAEDYLDFIERLVNITDHCLGDHIHGITNSYPWEQV